MVGSDSGLNIYGCISEFDILSKEQEKVVKSYYCSLFQTEAELRGCIESQYEINKELNHATVNCKSCKDIDL